MGVELNTGAQMLDSGGGTEACRGTGHTQDKAPAGRALRRAASVPEVMPGWDDQDKLGHLTSGCKPLQSLNL